MRYGRSRRSTAAGLAFNATPMVDVIFTLSIFFMLVSRFSSEETATMDLPNPKSSQAVPVKMPDRVVFNCRSGTDPDDPLQRVAYSLGSNRPESLATISDRLAALKRQSPDIKVVVRADRRLHYSDVQAAMKVVAANEIEMLNVVAHIDEGAGFAEDD